MLLLSELQDRKKEKDYQTILAELQIFQFSL